MQEELTIQEMFNRAFIGLRSQGFQQCSVKNELEIQQCVYKNGEMHCAWGWVDLSLEHERGTVYDLLREKRGLAANLNESQLAFAEELQATHDSFKKDIEPMEVRLRALAAKYGLTVPE